jgi:ubiquinone/menaquinone biosynthesis C-methylase UbiE
MKINYEDISRTYDKHRSYSKEEIKTIIEFAGVREGMKILDLGCGTGNVASQLLKLVNTHIVGVDISGPMLEVAISKSLEVVCANADSGLPFRDNSFDMVIIAYVLHHIDNLTSLFSECYRILRDGTLVIFTSSHQQIECLHTVIKEFFPSLIDIDKARFPDIPEIDSSLDSAGFVNIKYGKIHHENIPLDDEYLEKIRGKYVSTYHLLPQEEFHLGIARLEAYIKNHPQTEYREWQGTLISAKKKRHESISNQTVKRRRQPMG